MPVINGSPTEWDNLYTAIKEAEKTSNNIFPNGKTIISFDLQLYIKAIKLQAKRDVKNGFVFRMGELHVVFCVLKTLGKMIDDSGLDLVFQEAGMTLKINLQNESFLWEHNYSLTSYVSLPT